MLKTHLIIEGIDYPYTICGRASKVKLNLTEEIEEVTCQRCLHKIINTTDKDIEGGVKLKLIALSKLDSKNFFW